MGKRQVNYQVSFNPKCPTHRRLMDWIDEQTINRSSFIRETLSMRMMGLFGVRSIEPVQVKEDEFDVEEVLRLIQV